MLTLQNRSGAESFSILIILRRLVHFIILFAALGSIAPASAQTGFWDLAVTPTGGTVGADGKLYVSFSGYVKAIEFADSVAAVNIREGVSTLQQSFYYVGYDRFENPINDRRTVSISVSLAPGTHRLSLEAATVNGGFSSEIFTVVVLPPPYNGASFVAQSVPATMIAGQTYPVSVTMANSGTKTWVSGGVNPYRLGGQAPVESTWGFSRAELPAPVAPGGQTTFNFNVTAPQSGGSVGFQVGMLQEGVEWIGGLTPTVTVQVSIPQPAAAFSSPGEGASYTAVGGVSSVSFSGTADAGSGAVISNVQLLEDGAAFATATIGSISGSKVLAIGTHTIELRITDSRGQVARAYRAVRVVAPSTATFSSPASGATIPASGITTGVAVSASAVPGTGASIDLTRLFVNGAASITSAASTISATLPLPVGTHTLGVDAVDSNGVAGPRSFITVTVTPPAAPTALFSDPANGSSVVATGSAASVPVNATGMPATGASISQLKLYVDGALTQTANSAVLAGTLSLSIGTHALAIEAIDNFGTIGSRKSITVTVTGPPPPASAKFISPANGASFTLTGSTANVPVSATGVPAAGASVSQMKFYVDSVLIQTSPSANFSTTQALTLGNHTLGIEAVDNYGSVGPRHNISVVVARPSAPTASFSNPVSGSTFAANAGTTSLPVSGSATAGQGASISQMRLYVDGVQSSTSVTNVLSTTVSLSVGSHTLGMEAVDNFGTVGLRTTINVTVASASTATPIPVTITPPHLGDADAGTLPGNLSVDQGGAASYSVALALPPGSGGMAPSLSLNYSSNGNNGMVGLGWSLSGLSTMHRCVKTIAQDGYPGRIAFDAGDRLCLDGMRLLRSDGSGTNADTVYWQNPVGAQYRTEIEGFARITRLANGGFKVVQKSGRIQFFGTDTNSAIGAQGRTDGQPLLWALARTEDLSGNYITYEYSLDGTTGEYLPKQIRYGANSVAAQTADVAVRFSYEGRPDAQIQYMGGSRNDLRNRLTHIRTYINSAIDGTGGKLARDYTVSYVESANSSRSLVDSLQVCGDDGKCLPKTQMGWGSTSAKLVQKFAFRQYVNGDDENIPVKSVSGNFDGSGRTTIFYPVQGNPPCINCPSLMARPFTGVLHGDRAADEFMTGVDAVLSLPTGSVKYSEAIAGDLDGNGRDDMVLIASTRQWAYCLSVDSPDANPRFAPCLLGGTLPTSELPSLVSLRNNGKDQLISFYGTTNLYVCGFDNGTIQCALSAAEVPPASPAFDFVPIDLSKQGMTDFYTRYEGDGYTDGMMVCNYYGDKLKCKNVLVGSRTWFSPADMNGDGLTDIFFDKYLCLSMETDVNCRDNGIVSSGTTVSFVGAANFTGDGIPRYWSTSYSPTVIWLYTTVTGWPTWPKIPLTFNELPAPL